MYSLLRIHLQKSIPDRCQRIPPNTLVSDLEHAPVYTQAPYAIELHLDSTIIVNINIGVSQKEVPTLFCCLS